ncbi:MAG: histidinol dehydrogenase [Clostridia bacterium]
MIRVIKTNETEKISLLIKQLHCREESVVENVCEILGIVEKEGLKGVLELTKRFDGANLTKDSWLVSEAEFQSAYASVDEEFLIALRKAIMNIQDFHLKQVKKSWWQIDNQGNYTGQLIRPLERVGCYVPGGTAAYPSSVLMTVIPAKVAGVKETIVVSPPSKEGIINPYTLVAARECGADKVYKVGGAQAIGALAYGVEGLDRVQKIVGPGNIFVTMAKKQVYGQVDIDMLAGPSEILVIADATAKANYVAADLLSQAEHDIRAAAMLITTSLELAEEVKTELQEQLALLKRKNIAALSLKTNGAIIIVDSLEEAVDIANKIAPEHLELAVEAPFELLGKVENAGAIFLGHHSPEPLGDYYAGPNHVLPTGGTAKFYSSLNTDMYIKKSSIICYTKDGLKKVGKDVIKLATVEGLEAHANAIRVRMEE